jgi:hypothetical protein
METSDQRRATEHARGVGSRMDERRMTEVNAAIRDASLGGVESPSVATVTSEREINRT